MHFYLVDSFVQAKKYERELANIEARLTDLGVHGSVCRLNLLKDISELIHEAVERGVNTIVAVGDDQTLYKMINVVARFPVVVGIIPMGEQNTIARILGVSSIDSACDAIAKRITCDIDLGKANDIYFLSNMEAGNADIVLESEQGYRLLPSHKNARVIISNILPWSQQLAELAHNYMPDPTDGKIEALIAGAKPARGMASLFKRGHKYGVLDPKYLLDVTVLPVAKISLSSAPGTSTSLVIDGKRVIKPPVTISVAPGKLRVIVGKDRQFAYT